MRFFLIALLAITSASCSASPEDTSAPTPAPVVQQGDVLVTCTYKYDKKYNIEFVARNKTEYRPVAFPDLVIYHITDTKGVRWSINQYEWKDYTCTETKVEITKE